MVKSTHPNFISLDPNIKDMRDMDDKVGVILFYLYKFKKKTTSIEFLNWDYIELQKLKIYLENVDRLYYINATVEYDNNNLSNSRHYEMVARMQLLFDDNEIVITPIFIYFAFKAVLTCSFRKGEVYYNPEGLIYYSKDPCLFIKIIINSFTFPNKYLLYKTIKESLKKNDDIDDDDSKDTPQKLQNFCYETIYQNKKNTLRQWEYRYFFLPKRIKENVHKYIQMRKTFINLY